MSPAMTSHSDFTRVVYSGFIWQGIVPKGGERQVGRLLLNFGVGGKGSSTIILMSGMYINPPNTRTVPAQCILPPLPVLQQISYFRGIVSCLIVSKRGFVLIGLEA